MKNLVYLLGGFAVFCLCLSGALLPFATGLKSANDVRQAAGQAAAAPTPTSIPEISIGDVRGMLQDLQAHDENMSQKIVDVAISGDKAQTITAVSGDVSGAALPCLLGLGMVAAVGFLLLRGGGQGE